ncbi:Golgin subfamily A member 2 [Aphelenchoides fujianensis]|nr:Golgin subfamily A member 2 [Aphelenchoides fujianensis]
MSAADPNEARLLHAKKLLNKFQTRQQQPSADSPSMADVEVPPSVGVPSGGPSLRSSRSSSFVNVDMGHEPQFLNGGTPTNHGHYVELHKAYAELKQTAAANSANAEFSQQISQLQTALAIAVDEKTQLQAQLRSSNAHSKSLEAELELRARSSAAHSNDHQTAQLQAEIQKLSEKIAAQAATIAQQRKECADVEAKIVLVNQDKNDVQARLKYVYHEKDELNARLQELKNELNIKEIYIRQLSKHSAADSTSGQQTIQTLTEQKNFFEQELKQRTDELTQLRGEFNASKQHYESCLLQARTHSSSLEHALEAANQQKREVEFSKHCLEEELQLLRRRGGRAAGRQRAAACRRIRLDHDGRSR